MSIALIPTKEEFDIINMLSKTAAESAYFTKLGGLPGIMTIAFYAREMGVPMMTALMGGFSNIQGKITMSPELMNSLIRRAGHKMQILTSTNEICTIKGERIDTHETCTVSFTLQEARGAGLVKSGSGWEKYPSDMLFARCISRLRRRLFPDVATKCYVDGELDEEQASKGAIEVSSAGPIEDSCITHEECVFLDSLIGDDLEYRTNLLNWQKIDSLLKLKSSIYSKILDHVKKHNEKRLEKEIATKEETE